MRQFEEELESEDVDLFISKFEQEIDDEERYFQETGHMPESESVVDSLLDNINTVVQDAKEKLDNQDDQSEENVEAPELEDSPILTEDATAEEGIAEEAIENENIAENVPAEEQADGEVGSDFDMPLELDDDEIDLSAFIEESDDEAGEGADSENSDDIGLSLDDATADGADEEGLDDSLKEFLPDEMDALDEAQFGDGEELDLSGEGELDLENLLEGGDDEDLLDILRERKRRKRKRKRKRARKSLIHLYKSFCLFFLVHQMKMK